MEILFILLAFLVFLFAFALLFGAPFLPTALRQRNTALDMLELKSGQTLTDLGCGDGRVLKIAASRGIKVIGWEINPLLVIASMIRCLKVRRIVTIKWGNFWRQPLGEVDAIYVFLLKRYMPKLEKKISNEITKPVKVVSYAFSFPNHVPIRQKDGLMLYEFEPKKKD